METGPGSLSVLVETLRGMWNDLRLTVAAMVLGGLISGCLLGLLVSQSVAGTITAGVWCGAAAGVSAYFRLLHMRQARAEAMQTGSNTRLA